MTKNRAFFGFCVLVGVSGCGEPIPDPFAVQCPEFRADDETGEPLNTDPAVSSTSVNACKGAASQAEVDTTLLMATDLKKSLYHLVACGRFSRRFSAGVSTFFAAVSCGYPQNPTGFSYAGTGSYHAGGNLNVQTKLLKDTPFGKAGDDIPFDVFDTNNYFETNVIRAALSADASWNTNGDYGAHLSGVFEMTMTKPKSDALALWGIEALEGKTTTVQQEALEKAINESVAIVADGEVQELVDAGVTYKFAIPQISSGSMYQGKNASIEPISLSAKSPTTGQTASLVDWNLEFIPISAGAAKGSIVIYIEGGKFPYYVKYTFPSRIEPDVDITCTQPPPL